MSKWSSQKTRLGITLQDYNLIKKYICGESCIKKSFELLNKGISIHRQLVNREMKLILEKEQIGTMIFNVQKLPHKGVLLTELKPTKSGTNGTKFKQVMAHLDSMINKPIILNLHSETGHQAMMCASYITEQLASKYKAKTTNGIDLNLKSVDFNEDTISDLLSKDFLTIFASNKVLLTEHRQSYLDNLYALAQLKKVPIIISSKKEMINSEYIIINLKLTDTKKNEEQVIDDIFKTEEVK